MSVLPRILSIKQYILYHNLVTIHLFSYSTKCPI